MIEALAPQSIPNADIVVTDEIGDRLCAIQVKTRRNTGSDRDWHVKTKHEDGEMRRFRPDYSALGLGDTPGEGWLEQDYEAWNLLED